MAMSQATLKVKRQVRDYYNKNVNDIVTILKVAKAIGFKEEFSCCTQPNTDTQEQTD